METQGAQEVLAEVQQTLQAILQGQQALQQDVALLHTRLDNERRRRMNRAASEASVVNAPLAPLKIEASLPGLAPPGQVPNFGAFPFPATLGELVNINQHQHVEAIAQAYGLQLQYAEVPNKLMELMRFLCKDPLV